MIVIPANSSILLMSDDIRLDSRTLDSLFELAIGSKCFRFVNRDGRSKRA